MIVHKLSSLGGGLHSECSCSYWVYLMIKKICFMLKNPWHNKADKILQFCNARKDKLNTHVFLFIYIYIYFLKYYFSHTSYLSFFILLKLPK